MGTSGCQLYPLLLIGPWKQCNLCYIQCFCICLWFLYLQHVSNVLLSFCISSFFPSASHLMEFAVFAEHFCICWSFLCLPLIAVFGRAFSIWLDPLELQCVEHSRKKLREITSPLSFIPNISWAAGPHDCLPKPPKNQTHQSVALLATHITQFMYLSLPNIKHKWVAFLLFHETFFGEQK